MSKVSTTRCKNRQAPPNLFRVSIGGRPRYFVSYDASKDEFGHVSDYGAPRHFDLDHLLKVTQLNRAQLA